MVRHSWRTQLKAAMDERAVVDLVQRYLQEWTAVEADLLPEGAWPGPLPSTRAIVDHSLRLGQLHATSSGPSPGLAYLQEMLLFFTHAAVAVTRLAALDPPDDPPPRVRRTALRRRRRASA